MTAYWHGVVVVDRPIVDARGDPTVIEQADGRVAQLVGTATDAIRIAALSRPSLVVLRISLGELVDSDALRRLHALAPRCRVVVLPEPAAVVDRPSPTGAEWTDGTSGFDVLAAPWVTATVQTRTLPPHPASARRARKLVLEVGEAQGASAQLVRDAALVATELVANAISHAGTLVELTVRAGSATVRLEVSDLLAERPVPRVPSSGASGGRGMLLVGALALAWGIDPTHGGKTVWAQLGPSGDRPSLAGVR